MNEKLPDQEQIQDLLASLLGDEILVKPSEKKLEASALVKAVYVNSEGVPDKLLTCDLQFASGVGAALTKIPQGSVEEAIKSQSIPANIFENLYEVLNICVNVFPANTTNHVVLGELVKPNETPKNEIDEASIEDVVTFEVDIPRYGVGAVAFAQLAAAAQTA